MYRFVFSTWWVALKVHIKKTQAVFIVPSGGKLLLLHYNHGLRTPREEISFTTRPKIHYHSQIFRYGRCIFCLQHRPNFSDIFDLCLYWVSVVRDYNYKLWCSGRTKLKLHLFSILFWTFLHGLGISEKLKKFGVYLRICKTLGAFNSYVDKKRGKGSAKSPRLSKT